MALKVARVIVTFFCLVVTFFLLSRNFFGPELLAGAVS